MARQTGPANNFQAEADGYVAIRQSVTPVATIASNMAGKVNFFSNHNKCLVSKWFGVSGHATRTPSRKLRTSSRRLSESCDSWFEAPRTCAAAPPVALAA